MNSSMFGRLLWKEYRTQRSFWIGVAGIGLLIQLISLIAAYEPQQKTNALYYIALIFPVFYALGSSGMSFAIEKDDETWSFLRTLAIPPFRFYWMKFGFSFVSTLALGFTLALLAWILSAGHSPEITWNPGVSEVWQQFALSGFWIVITAEFLIWGIFVSLLTRRVLSAVCLTPICVFAIAFLSSYSETNFWIIRFFAVDCVLLLSLGLSCRWLNRETFGWSLPWSRVERRYRVDYLADVETAHPWRKLFKRLLWQEWRHARTICLTILGIATVFTILFFVGRATRTNSYFWGLGGIRYDKEALLFFPLISFICGLWSFRGEQEGKRFLFLIEQGASPRDIWLSKHLVWWGVVCVAVLLFLTVDVISYVFRSEGFLTPDIGRAIDHFGFLSSLFLLCYPLFICGIPYAVGQFSSMLFARSVMSAFVGVIILSAACAWFGLAIWLGTWMILSVAPIPFTLLAATWLRSSDWMLERPGWKPWAKLGTVLLVPTVLVFSWVIHYRVAEIKVTPELANNGIVPLLQPEIRPNSPEELKTIALYKDATEKSSRIQEATDAKPPVKDQDKPQKQAPAAGMGESMMGGVDDYEANPQQRIVSPLNGWKEATPGTVTWLEKNQAAVTLALEASRGAMAPLYDPEQKRRDHLEIRSLEQLAKLLLFQARKLEAENKLDEALECYLASLRIAQKVSHTSHGQRRGTVSWAYANNMQAVTLKWMQLWSTHPLQTKERILKAVSQVQAELDQFPPFSVAVKTDLWDLRNTFVEEPSELLAHQLSSSEPYTKSRAEQTLLTWSLIRQLFPWEIKRATLVLDELAYGNLNFFYELESRLNQRGRSMLDWRKQHSIFHQFRNMPGSPYQYGRIILHSAQRWKRTTPLLGPLAPEYSNMYRSVIDRKMKNNAHLLTLALVAYRHEHGELPEELSKLVDEKYFEELPLDPWSGSEFRYEPKGLDLDIRLGIETLEAGEPLLWSIGFGNGTIVEIEKETNGKPRYKIVSGAQRASRVGPVPNSGMVCRPFPIPKPQPILPELQSFLMRQR